MGRISRDVNTNSRPFQVFLKIHLAPVILACASCFLFLWRLGSSSLEDWDEAIYAEVSREIIRSGEWLTLHWNFHPWFEKPPLYMWITAIFYEIFGVSEFWSRALSAFAGLALLFITYRIGRVLKDRFTGLLSVAILLSIRQFVQYCRFGNTDITLISFIYVSILSYLYIRNGKERWWLGFWISIALAVMTKSAAGLILPVAVFVVEIISSTAAATLKSIYFRYGIALAILLVIPWHLYIVLRYGESFTDIYIGFQLIARATTALEEHTGDRYFYSYALARFYYPWITLFLFTIPWVISSFRKRSLELILWLFIAVVLLILTLMETKIEWYILPIYPALSLLISLQVSRAFRDTLAFASVMAAALWVAFSASVPMGLLVLSGFVMFLLIRKSGREFVFQALCGCSLLLFFSLSLPSLITLYDGKESAVEILSEMAGARGDLKDAPLLLLSGVDEPAPLFYSKRKVLSLNTPAEMKQTIGAGEMPVLLLKRDLPWCKPHYNFQYIAQSESYIFGKISVRDTRLLKAVQ